MSYFNNNPDRVFPTRTMDMRFLYGNPALLEKAYGLLCQEINGALGARIREHVKSARYNAKLAMRKGTQRFRKQDIAHFDLDEGIAFYDESPDSLGGMSLSFKVGPLRFVQYSFADWALKFACLSGDGNPFKKLPSNTVDRFLMLEAEGLTRLSHGQFRDIVDAYKYFLWLYHSSQFNFKNGSTSTQFDKSQVRERIDALDKILEGGLA